MSGTETSNKFIGLNQNIFLNDFLFHSHTQQIQEPKAQSILQRIAKSDKKAVSECLNNYGNLVWGVASAISNDPDKTEELVRDIFLDIWKYAGNFDSAKCEEKSFILLVANRRIKAYKLADKQ